MSHDIVVKQHAARSTSIPCLAHLRIHYYAARTAVAQDKPGHKLSVYILVVDDEPDVETLFRQQFRRDCAPALYDGVRPVGSAALVRAANVADPSLI